MQKSSRLKVLIADDDETIVKLLSRHVTKNGLTPVSAADGREALEVIEAQGEEICAAILDLQMPHKTGIECLREIKKTHPELSVVVLSAQGEIEDAVTAMKEGAVDYVRKPFSLDELFATLSQAIATHRLKTENRQLRAAVGTPEPRTRFVGNSPITQQLMTDVGRIAGIDNTILITGESGVGKSLLARLIHQASPRCDAPFVAVSCPALPRDLLESEMFGHEKGSFTGAHQQRLGKFEIANHGSIFLDEVGDMPIDLQPKLLSVLQEREFQRIGGMETLEADVRVIAATNADLPALIEQKAFREDLYYRLNVIPLRIPPLRERGEDIEELARHFLERIGSDRGVTPPHISPQAMEILLGYRWPGNVRQFENALERASAFCQDGVIDPDDLPAEIVTGCEDPASAVTTPDAGRSTLAELEKAAIESTLKQCGNNKAESARSLGISEKSIYNKMKRHGLR